MKTLFLFLLTFFLSIQAFSQDGSINLKFFDNNTGLAVECQSLDFANYTELKNRHFDITSNMKSKTIHCNLPNGSYEVTAKALNFKDMIFNAIIYSNEIVDYELNLEPFSLPSPPPSLLNINTTVIQGYIVDDNGNSIKQANIHAINSGIQTSSNNEGYFSLIIPVNMSVEKFKVSKAGYSDYDSGNFDIYPNGDHFVSIRLFANLGNLTISINCSISSLSQSKTQTISNNTLPSSIRVGRCSNCNLGLVNNCPDCCHGSFCTTNSVYTLQEYIKRVLPSEWFPQWSNIPGANEAFKAGAIAIRSYVISGVNPNLSFDICSDTYCQAFNFDLVSPGNSATNSAVDETEGVVLKYQGVVAHSEFSSETNSSLIGSCGGNNTITGECSDGYFYDNASGDCVADPVSIGKGKFGHNHNMSQTGSVRWASGLNLPSACDAGPQWYNNLAHIQLLQPHGYGTLNYCEILTHYYPNYEIVSYSNPNQFCSNQFCPDDYEPNNSFPTAHTINSGQPFSNTNIQPIIINSAISTGNDADIYRVGMDGKGVMTISLTNLPADYDMELYGLNGTGPAIGIGYNTGTSSENIIKNQSLNISTEWYIKIYPKNNLQFNSCSQYKLTVNWQPDNSSYVIPSGNYKTLLLSGLELDPINNDLIFMFQGIPCGLGDPPIDKTAKADEIKKMFKQALAVPENKHWISLDLNNCQSGYCVGDATYAAPFQNTDLIDKFYDADVKMKHDMFTTPLTGLGLNNGMLHDWSLDVMQSPFYSQIQSSGYNDYPRWQVRAQIKSDNLNYSSQGLNKIIINDAQMSLDKEVVFTSMDFTGSSLSTQIKNNLINLCQSTYKPQLLQRLVNGASITLPKINVTSSDYQTIRELYRVMAGAHWYRTLTNANKPYLNIINSGNLTGIARASSFNEPYWDAQAWQYLATEQYSDYNGNNSSSDIWGGVVLDNPVLINAGNFSSSQNIIDTFCFRNKGIATIGNETYFYAGGLDIPTTELSGSISRIGEIKNVKQENINVQVTIFNTGKKASGTFKVRLYEQNTNSPNILIQEQIISNIDSFASQNISFTWAPQTTGSRLLKVSIDEINQVIEKRKDDNVFYNSTIVYNNLPVIIFVDPQNGAGMANKNLTFDVNVYDNIDNWITGTNIHWKLDNVSLTSTGSILDIDTVTPGAHIIKCTATNSKGYSSSEEINIYAFPQGSPILSILSPSIGDTVSSGVNVLLQATANDLNDGNISQNIVWKSELGDTIGYGGSLNHSFSIGTHTITARIANTSGNISTTSVNIFAINGTPTISITSPATNSTYQQHQTISFSGNSMDYPDGNISGSIHWTSSIDGALGVGSPLNHLLSIGTHIITATIIDSHGQSVSATITVNILPTPPVATITSPLANSTYLFHNAVTLTGNATDLQDGILSGTHLQWFSSLQGLLGTGNNLTLNSLVYGTHVISLKATDNDGAYTTVSVQNIFVDAGQPTASITAPANSNSFNYGMPIIFTGTGNDPQNGTLSGTALQWSSSINGNIGTGNSITLSILSAGTHVIRLTATDNDGFSSYTERTIIIVPPHNPQISITQPVNNISIFNGSSIVISATASDYEDGILGNNSVSWASSISGNLGTGLQKTLNLSIGIHTITATATDVLGATSSVSRVITVLQNPPVVNILSPVNFSAYAQNTNITFTASATDYEDGTLSGTSIKWYSAGMLLGSGNPFSINSLTAGTHQVDCIVTDSNNGKDTATVFVNIQGLNNYVQTKFYPNIDSVMKNVGVGGQDTTIYVSLPQAAIVSNAQTAVQGLSYSVGGAMDTSFNSTDVGFGSGFGANNNIYASVLQPDGKLIICGNFTSYNGVGRTRIARINSDGTLDFTFDTGTGANSDILTIAIQSDGKIIIGGNFTSFNGVGRNRIARVNTDGTLDLSFFIGTGANNTVSSIAIQPDGKILLGGYFGFYNGISRSGIARLNIDGSLDATFNPGTGASGAYVYSLAIQSNGKIVIGGDFTFYNGVGRNRIARLNIDGTLDLTFNPGTGVDAAIFSIAIQGNGKILIGGNFGSYNLVNRGRIARINIDGSLDLSFNPGTGFNNWVNTLAIQGNGKLLIGGRFAVYNGVNRSKIAGLNSDGSLDLTFNPGSGFSINTSGIDGVNSITIMSSSNTYIGGDFTSFNGIGTSHITRLNIDGSLDASFNLGSGANNPVRVCQLQSDGKLIIGGQFTYFNNTLKNYIARLNTDGSLDTSFNPGSGANATVYTSSLQLDGKIIIGGYFTSYNGITRNFIARLNSDGSLDATFNPGSGASNIIFACALQPDGKILIGGAFTSFNGVIINRIARLNSDGSLDASFNIGSGANNQIFTILLQPDGKIVIGGLFTSYNGFGRNYIARLNTDGSLDTGFNPGSGANNNNIYATVIQPDGKIIIGGGFSSFNGVSRNCIARLNINGSLDTSFNPGSGANFFVESIIRQVDGKIIIGGGFGSFDGVIRSKIARLNIDGSLDLTFDPGTGANNDIHNIIETYDGKVVIGGNFTSFNNIGRNHLARLQNSIKYPYNPYLDFTNNGTHDWSYAGAYNVMQVTSNFATEINNYLATATPLANGNVLVPIKIHADSGGVIILKNLNIQYQFADVIAPSLTASITPNPVLKNSSYTITATASDNINMANVKALINGTLYTMTNTNGNNYTYSPSLSQTGIYPIKIIATDVNGLTKDTTINLNVIEAGQDLNISSINVSDTNPKAGDIIQVQTKIKNFGNTACNGAVIALKANNTIVSNQTINIASNDSVNITFNWTATLGTNTLSVVADPSNLFSETNEANNILSQTILVQDIIAPTITSATLTPNPVYAGQSFLVQIAATDNVAIGTVSAIFGGVSHNLVFNNTTNKYETSFTISTVGNFNITCNVGDTQGLSTQIILPVQVLNAGKDLYLNPQNIHVDTANNQLLLTISNLANQAISNFQIRVSNANTITTQTASITGNANLQVSVPWSFGCGTKTISISLDPNDLISETDETNNQTNVTTGICLPAVTNVSLGISPNPVLSNTATTILLLSTDSSFTSVVLNGLSTSYNLTYNHINGYSTTVVPTISGNYLVTVTAINSSGLSFILSDTMHVLSNLPDVTITDAFIQTFPVAENTSNSVLVKIANPSGVPVNNLQMKAFLNGIEINNFVVSIPATDTIQQTIAFTPNIGNDTLLIIADPSNVITETNENNNSKQLIFNAIDNEAPVFQFIGTNTPLYSGNNMLVTCEVTDNVQVASVLMQFNGQTYTLNYNASSQQYTINVPGVPQGNGTLHLTAADINGIQATALYNITVNNNQPDLTISPFDIEFINAPVNMDTIKVTVHNNGGSMATNASVQIKVDNNIISTQNANIAAGQTNTFITTYTGTYATYTITAIADYANAIVESNEGNNTATFNFNIWDNVAPSIPIVTVSPSIWTNGNSFNLSWLASTDNDAIASYEYRLNNGNWINAGNVLSTSFTSNLEGVSNVYVRAKDVSGNMSDAGVAQIMLDVTPPNAPIITEEHCGELWTTHNSPYLQWLIAGDIGSGIDHYEISIDGQTPINIGNVNFYHPSLTSGIHHLKLRGIDNVGLTGPWSNIDTVRIDIDAPPSPAINSPTHPNQNQWYQNDSIVLEITRPADLSGVTGYFWALSNDSSYLVSNANYWYAKDTLAITKIPSMDSNFVRIPDGIWYIHLIAKDSVGNYSSAAHYRFKIDKTAPETHYVTTNTIPVDTIMQCTPYIAHFIAEDYPSNVVSSFNYALNGGAFLSSYIDTIMVTSIGLNKLSFYSIDSAGNVESMDSIFIYLAGPDSLNIGNPLVIPTITITSNSQIQCDGDTLAFTALVINGGSSPIIQWRVDGVEVGNSISFSSSALINGQVLSCIVHSSNTCAVPDSAISNTILINKLTPKYWGLDDDLDGYYSGSLIYSCVSPSLDYFESTVLIGGGDCNDNNPAINPGAMEKCNNNLDDNCNGVIDEVNCCNYTSTTLEVVECDEYTWVNGTGNTYTQSGVYIKNTNSA